MDTCTYDQKTQQPVRPMREQRHKVGITMSIEMHQQQQTNMLQIATDSVGHGSHDSIRPIIVVSARAMVDTFFVAS